MNRAQNRKIKRAIISKGGNPLLAEFYQKMQKRKLPENAFAEGDKVKLNIPLITGHPDYERLTERYRNFIENHKDDIFTVVFDKNRQVNPSLVCLKEDSDGWLFWTGDLIKVSI